MAIRGGLMPVFRWVGSRSMKFARGWKKTELAMPSVVAKLYMHWYPQVDQYITWFLKCYCEDILAIGTILKRISSGYVVDGFLQKGYIADYALERWVEPWTWPWPFPYPWRFGEQFTCFFGWVRGACCLYLKHILPKHIHVIPSLAYGSHSN